MSARIFLTGVTGQVGGELRPLLDALGEVWAPSQEELDFVDPDSLREALRRFRPNWIVNPAAYTAVDKAESEPGVAYAVNRDAVTVIAEMARELEAGVIHFSTDYVYAGDGERPWTEQDTPAPLGVYGASKLAGDQALEASGVPYLIFRTSWVYGATGKNFLRTILGLARQKDELKIVADQHGAPTWSHDLAQVAANAIRASEGRAAHRPAAGLDGLSGVYHACNAGATTWFGFAEEFLRLAAEQEPGTRFARLMPIRTEDYPTPARRPENSRLNCAKLKDRLGFLMPEWRDATAAVMHQLLAVQ